MLEFCLQENFSSKLHSETQCFILGLNLFRGACTIALQIQPVDYSKGSAFCLKLT
jgi:hypothetical protein